MATIVSFFMLVRIFGPDIAQLPWQKAFDAPPVPQREMRAATAFVRGVTQYWAPKATAATDRRAAAPAIGFVAYRRNFAPIDGSPIAFLQFRLSKVLEDHRDAGGATIWSYVFTPVDAPLGMPRGLMFIYRKAPGTSVSAWAFVVERTNDDGYDVSENRVGSLLDFDNSPLAQKTLDPVSEHDPARWARSNSIPTIRTNSSFWDTGTHALPASLMPPVRAIGHSLYKHSRRLP